jgi:hypothetical protein
VSGRRFSPKNKTETLLYNGLFALIYKAFPGYKRTINAAQGMVHSSGPRQSTAE